MSWKDSRTENLNKLIYNYDKAFDKAGAISNWRSSMLQSSGAEDWASAFSFCSYALNAINQSLDYLISWSSSSPDIFVLTYFLTNYTIAEAPEIDLTWEAIVAAWSEADRLGRLWTVLSIDSMRKEVWNEPVTSFMLKSGAAAGL